MGYALRPGLSYCMVDGHAVFLDLPADRYFQLEEQVEGAFKTLCGGVPISALDMIMPTLARMVEEADGMDGLLPPAVPIATARSPAMNWDRPAVMPALAAILAQRRFERSLKSRGLARTMARLQSQKERSPVIAQGGGVQENWIRGFEQAKLLHSPVNHCLPRSMALASCLYRAGFRVQLVMGVRLPPFAAHCWVQDETMVLNDTPEEVATFTPIFVL